MLHDVRFGALLGQPVGALGLALLGQDGGLDLSADVLEGTHALWGALGHQDHVDVAHAVVSRALRSVALVLSVFALDLGLIRRILLGALRIGAFRIGVLLFHWTTENKHVGHVERTAGQGLEGLGGEERGVDLQLQLAGLHQTVIGGVAAVRGHGVVQLRAGQ